MGDLEREAPHRGHPLRHHQLVLRGLQARERARQLGIEPLDLDAGPPLAIGDHAHGQRGEADQPDQDEHGIPAHPRRRQHCRRRVEEPGHHRAPETDPGAEVVRVDGDQREEEEVEEAVVAAREVEEREDQEQVDGEGPTEHDARLARARVDADEGEDADLVGGEPEDQGGEVDAEPRPEGQAQGREAADHDHGQEGGEDTLVALEEANDGGPGPARRRRHGL